MDRIVGLELGADDYLPKPFNPRELLARLKAIARRGAMRSAKPDEALRFGRLIIQPQQRMVLLDGEERTLTSHQFDLLSALAENAGRVMSRDSLMNAVRGHDWMHSTAVSMYTSREFVRPSRITQIAQAGVDSARCRLPVCA